MAAQTEVSAVAAQRSTRLASIDLLRGITVAFMIMVNNNGQNDLAYRWMNHSPWNGFTPTDLVFPVFLFVVGISIVLSWGAHQAHRTPRTVLVSHILRRTVLLFIFGLIVNGFPYFHLGTLRIYGVLQRIAICYLLASLLQLITRRVSVWFALFLACVAGYWVLICLVPVPGHGIPGKNFPLLDPNINLTAYFDRHIFPHRLFEHTRDPEGLLSDIPSLATTLLGMLAGRWLTAARSAATKLSGMLASAFLLMAVGLLWSHSFPINKKLWTSSYVLYAGGWSLLILALLYFIVEIKQWRGRWMSPWLALGTNAIVAYVLSELLSSAVADFHVNALQSIQQFVYQGFFEHLGTPAFGSLIYSAVFALVCWMPVWLLYRRHIVIKL
ncbi:MAG TPA: heparan-alpha-glucosaminide N-acetyltransferase domain-containing protein [Acidobacteriaceae bacterium]|nr:heparan-alpha-glucosaminide N-acetyltransferase domain-containing protein [Acidobacteriaceae bacterium]